MEHSIGKCRIPLRQPCEIGTLISASSPFSHPPDHPDYLQAQDSLPPAGEGRKGNGKQTGNSTKGHTLGSPLQVRPALGKQIAGQQVIGDKGKQVPIVHRLIGRAHTSSYLCVGFSTSPCQSLLWLTKHQMPLCCQTPDETLLATTQADVPSDVSLYSHTGSLASRHLGSALWHSDPGNICMACGQGGEKRKKKKEK